VIESGPENFSAYVPNLPGCIATGKTLEEVLTNIRGAIEFHLEGLRADGLPIPDRRLAANTLKPIRGSESSPAHKCWTMTVRATAKP
jgi:predicted RNase H-like HicB family nuclease